MGSGTLPRPCWNLEDNRGGLLANKACKYAEGDHVVSPSLSFPASDIYHRVHASVNSYRNHNPQDGTIANGLDHCHPSQLGLHPLDNFRHRARPLSSHPSRLPASFAPLQRDRAFFEEARKGGSPPVTVQLALAGPPALLFDGVETSKSLPNTTGVQQYMQYTGTLAVAVILLTNYLGRSIASLLHRSSAGWPMWLVEFRVMYARE